MTPLVICSECSTQTAQSDIGLCYNCFKRALRNGKLEEARQAATEARYLRQETAATILAALIVRGCGDRACYAREAVTLADSLREELYKS